MVKAHENRNSLKLRIALNRFSQVSKFLDSAVLSEIQLLLPFADVAKGFLLAGNIENGEIWLPENSKRQYRQLWCFSFVLLLWGLMKKMRCCISEPGQDCKNHWTSKTLTLIGSYAAQSTKTSNQNKFSDVFLLSTSSWFQSISEIVVVYCRSVIYANVWLQLSDDLEWYLNNFWRPLFFQN